jgi:hypothetical protein
MEMLNLITCSARTHPLYDVTPHPMKLCIELGLGSLISSWPVIVGEGQRGQFKF